MEIKLTNFKCFKEETSIPLSNFNLFTGVNGAGKSSALQALLLMRQSIEHNPYTAELILNGNCVNLGSFDDVRNRGVSKNNPIFFEFLYHADNDEEGLLSISYHLEANVDEISLIIPKVSISLTCLLVEREGEPEKRESSEKYIVYDIKNNVRFLEGKDCTICENKEFYKYPNLEGYYQIFDLNNPNLDDIAYRRNIDSNQFSAPKVISKFNSNIDNIHFISADRIGPQEFYQKAMLSNFYHVGTKGEFTINLLNKIGKELEVNEDLYLKETPGFLGENPITLKSQTEAWIGKILNPLSLDANPLGKSNFLELLIGGFKPSNVGFGYSSILPIIVTGLIAKPGEKIIIENPEIHLHPKAQSALIEFLAKVANTGVQIFIESHSDHVLNALRIATKNKLINPEDVNILFFGLENGNSKIIKPTLDENGRIDQWPEYFFDETAKSLASLAAGQRPRIKAPKAEV